MDTKEISNVLKVYVKVSETKKLICDDELIEIISQIANDRWHNSEDEECKRIFMNIWHTIQYD